MKITIKKQNPQTVDGRHFYIKQAVTNCAFKINVMKRDLDLYDLSLFLDEGTQRRKSKHLVFKL